jgi:hypothetical protein
VAVEVQRRRVQGEQRRGPRVYCGLTSLITRDHIFPRVLFRVKDADMLVVPSCATCQQEKGLGDRDLGYLVRPTPQDGISLPTDRLGRVILPE